MSRIRELEARRRALIERCDAQRAELGARIAGLNPLGSLRRGLGSGLGQLRPPLAWIAALAGVLLLGRTRQALTLTLWVREALAIAGRAAQIMRLVTELRGSRASEKSAAHPPATAPPPDSPRL